MPSLIRRRRVGWPTSRQAKAGGGVHVVVGEHADGLELGVVEQVGFVDDQDGGAAAFGVLGGEQRRRPGGQGGGVDAAGLPPRAVTMAWWMPRTPTAGLPR